MVANLNCKFSIFSLFLKVPMIFSGLLAHGLKYYTFYCPTRMTRKFLPLMYLSQPSEHNFCQLFPYTCSRPKSAFQFLVTNFGYVLELSQLLSVIRKIISVLYYYSLYICQFQSASQCLWLEEMVLTEYYTHTHWISAHASLK